MASNRISDIPGRAINKLLRRFYPLDSSQLDSFLKDVPGVIHVGANIGQEREEYASLGLKVAWVEPIPAVFETLRSNISGLANQRAYQYLLAAEEGVEYTFHVADNGGASSSIFEFAKHRKLHPDIHFVQDIRITAERCHSGSRSVPVCAKRSCRF
jgi:FkbM family methyltransferase